MKTDSQIESDVRDELAWDPSVNSRDIIVSSRNGLITLRGTVDSYSKKVAADKAALRIQGVMGVINTIEIKLAKTLEREDADIEMAVNSALAWRSSIPKQNIKTSVKDGWVTIDGEVEWDFQIIFFKLKFLFGFCVCLQSPELNFCFVHAACHCFV